MKPRVPTRAETDLLTLFPDYGLLTAEQLQYLAAYATLRYAQVRLKTLSDLGYLDRPHKAGLAVGGSEPLVYWLSRRGRDFLKKQGIDPGATYKEPASITRRHSLAVNDVLIAAELLCRHDDRFQLAEKRTDRQLRHEVKGPAVPDGFLDFRLHTSDGTYQVPFLLEVDRGTMARQRFQHKVEALENWITTGGYQVTFGTDALQAIAVLSSHAFVAEWITSSAHHPTLFRVTEVRPLPNFRRFFLAPVWILPGTKEPVPLIET